MIAVDRFQGGRRLMTTSGIVGVAGLLLTLVGAFTNPKEAAYSYLFAFTYWAGIAFAAIILLAAFVASKAKWIVVLRRALELMGVTSGIFVVLFIPVVVGAKQIFPWVEPSEHLSHEIAHKLAYLNVSAFVVRAILYFIICVGVSELLLSWSVKQDESGDPAFTQKQRLLSGGALPFLALAITFAGFDWLMSLSPTWFSTIFGAYYFAGSFLGAIAIWTLCTAWARGRKDLFGDLVTPEHLHNLGKLLLAFTAFWAYIAFAQYMLMWIGNLPDENFWYLVRTRHGWKPVGIFLALGQFLVPFFILLGQQRKRHIPFLIGMSLWLLFAHLVDIYWLVLPTLHPEAPALHWTNLTAFVGVGGVAVAYGLFRARGGYTLAIRDPYLADSMRYTQP